MGTPARAWSARPKRTPAPAARSATIRFAMLPTSRKFPARVVVSASAYALYQILTRRIAGIDSPETSAIYSSTVGGFGLILILPFVWQTPHSLLHVALFCSLGVLGAIGHYCVARAMHLAPANVISPFQYFQLLSSVAVGYFFFGNFPDLIGWLGAAIIVAAGLYIGVSQRKVG